MSCGATQKHARYRIEGPRPRLRTARVDLSVCGRANGRAAVPRSMCWRHHAVTNTLARYARNRFSIAVVLT